MATYSFTFRSSLGERSIRTLPRNWKDLRFQLVRDRTFKGIGRKIAATFEFVKDARKYVRDLYYIEGIDAYMEVDVWIHNDSKWRSRELLQTYKADFSDIEITDVIASIKLLDSDFEEKINSRSSTKINLNTLTSIDGDVLTGVDNPVVPLLLHDRTIQLNNKHIAKDGPEGKTSIQRLAQINPIDVDIVFSANKQVNNVTFNRIEGAYPGWSNATPEMIFLSRAEKDTRLYISFNFSLLLTVSSFNNGDTLRLKIMSVDSDTLEYQDTLFSQVIYNILGETTKKLVVSLGTSINILAGQSIVIGYDTSEPGNTVRVDHEAYPDEPCTIETYNIDYYDKAPTTCYVMPPHETAERLLQLMTGRQTPLFAPVFGRTDLGYTTDGAWAYLCLTNGYAVRQFDKDEHPINTSFKDWFKSYSSVINLAAYIDNTDGNQRMVIDYFENVFDSSKIGHRVTRYSDLSVKPMKDDYFGTLKFGYPDVEHENEVGLDPFNGELHYSTPITNVTDELDNVSVYISDDYAFAIPQRLPYQEFPKEDTRYDDKNMLIHGRMSNGYLIAKRAEDFDTVSGILNPLNAYNLNISPMRNLLRHASYLAVGLYRKADKVIKFVKGAKNSNLVTKLNSENRIVRENRDYPIADLGTPIFLPNYISFKTELTWQEFKYLNQHPNELIEMSIDGVMTYGFIDTLEYSITTREAEFTLIQSNR